MQLLGNSQVSTSSQKPCRFIDILVRWFRAAREPVVFWKIDVQRGERAADAFFQVWKTIRDEASPEHLNILDNTQSRNHFNKILVGFHNSISRSQRKKDSCNFFKISRSFYALFLIVFKLHYNLFNISGFLLHFERIQAKILSKMQVSGTFSAHRGERRQEGNIMLGNIQHENQRVVIAKS